MKIVNINSKSWTSNCYVIISEGHALVVDPSSSSKEILRVIEAENASLEGILITHGHFDHIISLDVLREATSAPAYIHMLDAEMLLDGRKNAFYIFFGKDRAYRPAEKTVDDGDIIQFADKQIKVIHTPGHTKGSVCYLIDDILFSGDTLLEGSYGRCDLYGGSIKMMADSLKRLRLLDSSLTLYAGHGEPSTLGNALDNAAYMLDF